MRGPDVAVAPPTPDVGLSGACAAGAQRGGATGAVTEREMLDHLHNRYNNHRHMQRGNGIRWVCAEHVRSDAGFWAARTADFIAVDMYPGTGNAIHGHEVKVSRSDWLSELRQPEKSLPFRELVDHWWLVVPDAAMVHADELPPDWGLMVLSGGGLRAKVRAKRLHGAGGTSLAAHREQAALPRGFVASLLRATHKTSAGR